MTSRQEKFARNVAKGMTQRAAYRDAYPNARKWKDGVVDSKASHLVNNRQVSGKLAELRKQAESAAVLSRQKRLETLSRIAVENEKLSPKDSIAAIKILNDMTGDNAPAKTEVTVDILSAIVERHRNVIEEG
jgi:hypothetical protein